MNRKLYELTRTPRSKFLEGLIPGAIIGTYWRGAYPKSEDGLETAHEVLYKDWQSSPNSKTKQQALNRFVEIYISGKNATPEQHQKNLEKYGATETSQSPSNYNLKYIKDRKFIKIFNSIYTKGKQIVIDDKIKNTDRSLGAMFSGHLAKKFGHKGLKEDSVRINLKGTAGQSFGAFTSYGITLHLEGEGNDYVGKGLCGGKIVIKPTSDSKIIPEKSIIVGNTVLYGAIAGECYFRGIAGERFAVRNSGAWAVVEGLGDHGCMAPRCDHRLSLHQ